MEKKVCRFNLFKINFLLIKGSPSNSPPSVQHTRSQLIKEGLKLTIQTKRKHSGSDTKEEFEEIESKRMKREEVST